MMFFLFSMNLSYICKGAAVGLYPGNRAHGPRQFTAPACPVYWKAPHHVIIHATESTLLCSAQEYIHSLLGAREEKRGKKCEKDRDFPPLFSFFYRLA